MVDRKTVLVIAPAYNEAGKIGEVVRKTLLQRPQVTDILVVDDCSSDNTAREAAEAGAIVLSHSRNRGVGAAIRSGILYAAEHSYDYCVIISGDDQHDPSELPGFLRPLLSGEADFIQGSRYLKGGKTVHQPAFRRFATRLYTPIFYVFTGKYCSDVTNGMRAFSPRLLLDDPDIDLRQDWLDRYELEIYIMYKVYRSRNIRVKEMPNTILYHETKSNTKMIPVIDWWRTLRPVILLALHLKK